MPIFVQIHQLQWYYIKNFHFNQKNYIHNNKRKIKYIILLMFMNVVMEDIRLLLQKR